MDQHKSVPLSDKDAQKQITMRKTLAIATEFGFIIVLPLLVFGLLGKWLEGRYHNKLWLIGCIMLSLIATSIWFYKRIVEIYDEYTKL